MFAAEAIKYYETLVQEGSAEPAVQYETAVGYRSLGFMFQNDPVRDDVRAEELVRKSIAILEELLRDDPNDALYRQQLGWSSWVLAHTLRRTERLAEAESSAARAAELYEALLAEAPADSDYLNEAQTVYATLGGIRGEAKLADEAIAAYLRLIAIYEQAVAHAENPSLRPTPPFYPQRGLVELLVEEGQWPEALAQSRKVLAWDPNRTQSWMWAASLQLQAGEAEGYRQIGREMVDQFGDGDNLLALECTAKTSRSGARHLRRPPRARRAGRSRARGQRNAPLLLELHRRQGPGRVPRRTRRDGDLLDAAPPVPASSAPHP